MAQNTLESFLNANDGNLSLEMQSGEQCFIQTTTDGKVNIVGADGKVKLSDDFITPVDPKDPKVIGIAKNAANKNNVVLVSVICGVKVKALFTTAYCLLISGKDTKGAKNLYFTAVVGSSVLFFKYVMPFPF